MRVLLFLMALSQTSWAKPSCQAFQASLKTVRFVPYVADGELRGYVLHDIKPDALLYKAGGRELDLLVEIDGRKLTDEKAVKAGLEGICGEGRSQTRFSVLRSGNPLTLDIALSRK